MRKAIISTAAFVVTFVGFYILTGKAQQQEENAKKVQQMFTNATAFRSTLVQFLRDAEAHNVEHEGHHKELFKADGPWGKILAEKEAILAEALGPAYKSHKNISMFEVEVLYNLGRLDTIRSFDSIQKIRAGKFVP